MYKLKLIISILAFSFCLILTSSIKNQTREIEKKINVLSSKNFQKEKDLNEIQLDFHYLTSPSIIEKKIEYIGIQKYISMEYSNLFFNMEDFFNLHNKIAAQEALDDKKIEKK